MHALPPPTDRGCLIAWNAPANAANRHRLAGTRLATGLSLRPGVVGRDTWTQGATPTHTSTPACLLTVGASGGARIVIGAWRDGRVASWSWSRGIATGGPVVANVRRLADGRVTKLYRR
jgi:hypothetical protein